MEERIGGKRKEVVVVGMTSSLAYQAGAVCVCITCLAASRPLAKRRGWLKGLEHPGDSLFDGNRSEKGARE